MQDAIGYSLTVFMGFFAIMNPIANAPIFLGLTSNFTREETKKIASQATLLAFVIVATFSIGGQFLFQMFRIGLPAFRVTGGILVFIVGKHLLEGAKTTPVHTPGALKDALPPDAPGAIALSPLAIPILSGPGTIACGISFASGQSPLRIGICLGSFAVLCCITYFVFVSAQKVMDRIGPHAIGVISRLMGLILAVIGTQMVFQGLADEFPALFR